MPQVKKIAILGGSGYIGKKLMETALQRNIMLKVLTRNQENLSRFSGKIEVVQGNLSDPQALKQLVEGIDAVISVAGPPMKGNYDPGLYILGMEELMKAMTAEGVSRIVTIAGGSIKLPEEQLGLKRKFLRCNFKLLFGKLVAVKDAEAKLLYNSDLKWTIVRPGFVKKVKTGEFKADRHKLHATSVDRTQLVEFLLDCLESDEWERSAPLVATS